MTGWRRRLPRYRTREYTSALTGRPVLVQVPTVWGRVARWWDGRWSFDPFDPRLNLAYGLKVKRLSGWSAWVTY